MGKGGSTDCCKGPGYASPLVRSSKSFGRIERVSRFGEHVTCLPGPGQTRSSLSQDAMHKGPRERLAYIPAVQPKQDKPDYLMTVDLDPDSPSYSQVRYRVLVKPGNLFLFRSSNTTRHSRKCNMSLINMTYDPV